MLDWGVVLLLFAACALLAARLERLHAVDTSGTVIVHDGDTITQAGERIRLAGVDAFERDQTCRRDGGSYPCGAEATRALRELTRRGDVACTGSGRDRYRRLLSVCTVDGTDINREMVAAGWALAYGGYRDAEREARTAGRGAWAGEFDPPADWRAARGGMAEAPHDALASLTAWLRRLFEQE